MKKSFNGEFEDLEKGYRTQKSEIIMETAEKLDTVEPIRCRECGKSTLGVGNFRTGRVIIYEKDDYPNQKIEHQHPADVVTRTDIMHRTAVEMRYIRAPNRDDYRYLIDDKRRIMI